MKKKILVVDDESSIVEIWKEVFEALGHEVSTAHNGDNGVKLIKETDFDLILTDMKMPGSDGTVILDHVANIEKNPKLILSSGYIQEDDLITKYNIDKFIQKPFSIEKELIAIQQLLDN
jgi:two-component system NtrC family response regulator